MLFTNNSSKLWYIYRRHYKSNFHTYVGNTRLLPTLPNIRQYRKLWNTTTVRARNTNKQTDTTLYCFFLCFENIDCYTSCLPSSRMRVFISGIFAVIVNFKYILCVYFYIIYKYSNYFWLCNEVLNCPG